MRLFALEHSKRAYWADIAVYTAAVALGAGLLLAAPPAEAVESVLLVAAGLTGWTLIEYLLHRFVLHGLPPFDRWHARHHQRPMALIASPTLFSAFLLLTLVFLPAWLASGPWPAGALTLGVLVGYLGYTLTHHATHHWNLDSAWLKRRKRAHALHHHLGEAANYGVTTSFWDRVFRTSPAQRCIGR
jgi:sterol desaturase/sphingolipid hydroxylase (fatty acid hydroxylase superfamily)